MPGRERRGEAASTRLRCASCGGALRPAHRFCPHCGAPQAGQTSNATLTAPRQVGGPSLQVPSSSTAVDLSENRRLVTVLFADLSGSTTLGERLDPEDLRQILASFFSVLA